MLGACSSVRVQLDCFSLANANQAKLCLLQLLTTLWEHASTLHRQVEFVLNGMRSKQTSWKGCCPGGTDLQDTAEILSVSSVLATKLSEMGSRIGATLTFGLLCGTTSLLEALPGANTLAFRQVRHCS